jgi:hypothetical protein
MQGTLKQGNYQEAKPEDSLIREDLTNPSGPALTRANSFAPHMGIVKQKFSRNPIEGSTKRSSVLRRRNGWTQWKIGTSVGDVL